MWKSEVGAIPIVLSKGRLPSMYYYIDKDLDFQKKADIDMGVGSAVEGVCVNEGPNPMDVVPTDSVMKGGDVKHVEELEKQSQFTMCEANRWGETLIVTPPTQSSSHPPRRAKLPVRRAKTTTKQSQSDCSSRRSTRFIKNPTIQCIELAGHLQHSPSSSSIKKSLRLKVCQIKESTPIPSVNASPSIREAPIRKASLGKQQLLTFPNNLPSLLQLEDLQGSQKALLHSPMK